MIIAYTIDKQAGIYNSLGEYCNEPPYLDFLLKDYGKDCIKVFANIDYDIANLLCLADFNNRELNTLAKGGIIFAHPYKIRYYSGKYFGINKNNNCYGGFSDISQYNDALNIYEDRHDKEYHEHRVKVAKEIAEEVYKSFIELGLKPKYLISPANVYKKEVMLKNDMVNVDDIPIDASEIAFECCQGNWLEAYKIGHFKNVYDYDLNSAFPYEASKLLDLRFGKWIQSSEYQPDATYGYCRGEVFIAPEVKFSPMLYKVASDRLFTPSGTWETSTTKGMIDFINEYNLGYFTITDGWWWFKDKEIYPLNQQIVKLHNEKKSSIGIKREVIKRIMSGCFYGLFIETRNGSTGDYFISPWAAEIETNTRIRVAKKCLDNNIEPLHIAVDGFISEKPVPCVIDDIIGEWRLSHNGSCIIASTGTVGMEGKIGSGDFSLSYDWLMDKINSNPDDNFYDKTKLSPVTLAKCYIKGNYGDLGNLEVIRRVVNFTDIKRRYKNLPKNGGELLNGQYNSNAWPVKLLQLLSSKGEYDGQ